MYNYEREKYGKLLKSIAYNNIEESDDYWYASDIMFVIGLIDWVNFEEYLLKAYSTWINYDYLRDERIEKTERSIVLNDGTRKYFTDYKLNESACYLLLEEFLDMLSVRVGNSSRSMFYVSSGSYRNSTDITIPNLNIDNVQFSVVAPLKNENKKYFEVIIVMYEPSSRRVVDDLLSSFQDNNYKLSERSKGGFRIGQDARVRVELSSPEIIISNDVQELIWIRDYLVFNFVIKASELYYGNQTKLTTKIYLNNLLATCLDFVVEQKGEEYNAIDFQRKDLRRVFISYSHKDSKRVIPIVQGMKIARRDLDIFIDIVEITSGKDWERKIEEKINYSDVLYLCWSKHASQSDVVDYAWRYAYKTKGIDGIEPIFIDSPDICPLPQELRKKHFEDSNVFAKQYYDMLDISHI